VPGTSAMYCPPALDDDDDDVSTTWVASNLPELTDPTALEISTLCGCFGADRVYPHRYDLSVSTCGRSFSHLHWLLVVGVMCLLRPILSFFRWGQTQGPLPVPWLSPPDVPTQDLATAMVDIIAARPDAPPDVISQELCDRFPGSSLPQR